MADTDAAKMLLCDVCGYKGLDDGNDGFFYCQRCGARAQDIVDTGIADEDFIHTGPSAPVYMASQRRSQPTPAIKTEPLSQTQSFYHSLSQSFEDDATVVKETKQNFEDHDPDYEPNYVPDSVRPTEPTDFGSGQRSIRDEDYYTEVRMKYVMGIQLMIQYQCEALVENFKVTPLICGIAGSLWLRFIAFTRVFADKWAEDAMLESEIQGKREFKGGAKYYGHEPRNMYNRRMVIVWHQSLKKKIPLSYSLAISFLACHVVREPILPTDIHKWVLEGKLPYLSAFVEIEKYIKCPSITCPLTASYMFRPSKAIPLLKLESLAASIAERIGLSLPPINFSGIASRYLKQLCLPVEKILPYACRISDWSMPPDLWLSANESRLPTRVCVMSIVIVAVRILYNINGLGKWEMSLNTSDDSSLRDEMGNLVLKDNDDLDGESGRSLSSTHKFESEATELLCELARKYNDKDDKYEYMEDLPTYLQYCRDVVFSGLEPRIDDYTEEKMIQKLWDNYTNSQKDSDAAEESDAGLNHKRLKVDTASDDSSGHKNGRSREDQTTGYQSPPVFGAFEASSNPGKSPADAQELKVTGANGFREAAIKEMKSDMEENLFLYIPPRENIKTNEYLHYARRKDDGSLNYIAHADYYILLRACAKVVQVDVRVLHLGVMELERRLAWIENKIVHCLHMKPAKISCKFCTQEDCGYPSEEHR